MIDRKLSISDLKELAKEHEMIQVFLDANSGSQSFRLNCVSYFQIENYGDCQYIRCINLDGSKGYVFPL